MNNVFRMCEVALVLSLSVCTLESWAAAPGLELLPTPSGSVMRTPDGGFMAWRITPRDTAGKLLRLKGRFSNDDCRTWSEERLLCKIPVTDEGNYHTGMGLCDRDGVMHILGLHYYEVKSFHEWENARSFLYHMMSADGGKTWTQPQHAEFGYLYTGALNSLLQLQSGRILAPISYYSKRMTGHFVSKLSISDDGGKTWRPSQGEVIVDTGGHLLEGGACEPVCLELRDGRVWMLIRTQGGYQYEAFSKDGGETWTDPRPSRFVSSNAPGAFLRMNSGAIVFVWNNCMSPYDEGNTLTSYDRWTLSAAISHDDGKNWHGYREIAAVKKEGEKPVAYASLNESSDGAILSQTAKLIRVSPEWLIEKTFSDNFDSGLEQWNTLACEGVEAIEHPDRAEAKVLVMRKPKANIPAAASLNFPFGVRGKLTMRIQMKPNDNWITRQHYNFCLTDFFSMPRLPPILKERGPTGWGIFPAEGRFTFRIAPNGDIQTATGRSLFQDEFTPTKAKLEPGVWHTLELNWDCEQGRCAMLLDGKHIAGMPQLSRAVGLCYLRLWMNVQGLEPEGIMLESVDIKVEP